MTRQMTDFLQDHSMILEGILNHVPDLMFLMAANGDGRFIYMMMNQAAMRATGLTSSAYGKTMDEVMPAERAKVLNAYYQEVLLAREPVTFVESFQGSYGETVLSPVFSDDGECTHIVAITRDITSHQTYQQQLTHLAYHDHLTGLPNRRQLVESLRTLEAVAKERDRQLTVMYIDCDAFKSVNDTFGHDVGDEYLVIMSKRLRHGLRDADILCRLGGDEFVAVVTVDDVEQAKQISERVLANVRQVINVGIHKLYGSMSIGIAMYPLDGPDLDIVMKKADQALQEAKKSGRNQSFVYERQLR